MTNSALATCSNVLDTIKSSHLDFYLQETPYSAFITIRKKYVKNFQPSEQKYTSIASSTVIENLELENKKLKIENQEVKAESEKSRNELLIVQKKLEKAENDLLKNFKDRKNEKSKLCEEIEVMKALKKKDNDAISVLTMDLSKAKTEIKSMMKALYNMENKNENTKDKLDKLNASNNEMMKEKKKLTNENKNLKKKIDNFEGANNNTMNSCKQSSNSSSISFSHASSQTTPVKSSETSVPTSTPELKCLICGKICDDNNILKKHSEADHGLSIDIEKLTDPCEADSTSRFIKSLIVDPGYLKERVKCFPEHWDHINERIKIRMVAKMNFADKSELIERNMKQMDFRKVYYEGKCFETSML